MKALSPTTSAPTLATRLPLTGLALAVVAIFLLTGCASKPKEEARPYAFWPPYPDEPRLQYLCSFSSSASVEGGKSKLDELVYGKEVEAVQNLVKPYGLDMHGGKIYVCDLRSACITVLDIRNQQTLLMGRSGTETLQTPTDIAIADDGTKYVADLNRGRVFVFDASDRLATTFGVEHCKPVGVAVYQNELYVCDFGNQCVQVLDRKSGSLLRKIGSPGQGPGQFVRPLGIAVDTQGNVYVSDVLNCKLQKFDRAGNYVSSFGMISANVGGMVRPKHIDVDRDGTIYVVDAAFQNVQLFDQVGRVFTYFGSAGSHPGAMYLPAGVNVHEGDLDVFAKYVHPSFQVERLVLVSNQFGPDKVAVYGLGKLKPGATVQDIEASKDVVRNGMNDGSKNKIGPSTLPGAAPDDLQAVPVPTTSTASTMKPNAQGR